MSLAKEIFDNAISKGFYDEFIILMNHPHLSKSEKAFIRYLWRSNRLMLIVSELGEALEGLRNNNLSGEPKSGGFGEELADARIRLDDLMWAEYKEKMGRIIKGKHEYNLTRPFKHGGKVG